MGILLPTFQEERASEQTQVILHIARLEFPAPMTLISGQTQRYIWPKSWSVMQTIRFSSMDVFLWTFHPFCCVATPSIIA